MRLATVMLEWFAIAALTLVAIVYVPLEATRLLLESIRPDPTDPAPREF